jgi:putative hydrolase of the HAD superfamily
MTTVPDIQAILFDMGRVLVDIDNHLLVEKLFKNLSVTDVQELGRKTMGHPAMVEFNTGRMDPRRFHRHMCENFQLDVDYEGFTSLWCEIFKTMEGMEELVATISPQITIGLLSDTDPIHWDHIRSTWPWVGDIQNPTLSYEIGVMKPDPAIFQAAARNVKTSSRHCLFIDDLDINVLGARAVGMHAIRFETVNRLTEELTQLGLLV